MIATPLLVALVLVGVSSLASGAALLRSRRAVVPAGLLVVAGVATLAATTSARADLDRLTATLLAVAGAGALPLALTTYPRPAWRHPVDFLALVTVGGAALVLAVAPREPTVLTVMPMTIGLTLIAHTWWRIERAAPPERGPLLWMALAVAVAALVAGFLTFMAEGTSTATGTVVTAVALGLFAVVGPAMYVGASRPEVVDVRALVVRAVVFAVTLICYLAVFVSLVSLLEILGEDRPVVGVLAVLGGLVAFAVHPLQVVLRGVVDEVLFGRRPDPLGAASHVADHVGDDPVLALRAIREALVLPYAALHVDGEEVARSGTPVTHTHTLPLPLGGEVDGALHVGLRSGDLGLSPGDRNVLRLVAPLLAQSVRARALAAAVQASREGVVSAVEEERRRLRRDLHDGLGPRLSGIAFTSDAARNLLGSDPEAADALLRSLRAETVAAIGEIRELVYGMRPPALDELGLVRAVAQQTAAVSTPDGRRLQVHLESGDLPPLPAAVEVAAYRIAVEGVSNAARHSGADLARVRLDVADGALLVEVVDGGAGTGAWRPGVGLSSMRERAAEVGGTLEYGAVPGGGRVRAVLPLGAR